MPKSKRNKIVHLTQVKKKGKDHKEDLVRQLEEYVAKYQRVYVFNFDETKSDRIMNLRLKLKDTGRIFSGKNSLVSLTLRNIGLRTRTDYSHFVKHVTGHRGLLFSDIESAKLVDLLSAEVPEFCEKLLGYAQLAPETVVMEVDGEEKKSKKGGGKKRKSRENREVVFVKI